MFSEAAYHVVQHVAELDSVLRARGEHLAVVLVFGLKTLPLPPPLLLVESPFGLLDELESHRYGSPS
jgi:hypothetical protein